MTSQSLTRRGAARRAAIAAASLSAVAATLSAWAVFVPGVADAAPTDSGLAAIVTPSGGAGAGQPLAGGGSATAFSIDLPAGAACTSDGLNGGRVNSYMIPGTQNPAADLTFNGNGSLVGQSTGTGGTGTFRQNLFTTTNLPARGSVIALNINDAAVINIPNFDLDVFTPGQIPVGVYNVGLACVDLDEPVPSGSTFAPNNFWNTRITLVADGTDPDGFTFTVTPPTPTSSTTSTTAAGGSTTSTSAGGSTTTTSAAGGSTTTTTSAGGSTTTTVVGSSTTEFATATTSTGGRGSGLPASGSDALRLTVWALLFATFGRIAIVLGRSAPSAGNGSKAPR